MLFEDQNGKIRTKVIFYGTRGSFSVEGEGHTEFGGETSCCLFMSGDTRVLIDAGSGASGAAEDLKSAGTLYLLLTHPHFDHLSGIVALLPAFVGKKIHIYGRVLDGRSVREQVMALMGPPLWPVEPDRFGCVEWHDLEGDDGVLTLEGVHVAYTASNHPGGGTLYRLSDGEHSVVAAFDFNHADGYEQKLISFAAGCDMLIYDGNMSEEDYGRYSDWGHSTPRAGVRIAKACGTDRLVITHHASYATDDMLLAAEAALKEVYPRSCYARDWMIFDLGSEEVAEQKTDLKNKFRMLLDIGIMLASEKDRTMLLELILRKALAITGADAGTLYICGEDCLYFKIMITQSVGYFKGGKGDPIELPPVKMSIENVCSAAVLERRLINIPDVYNCSDTKYDFSGPMKYDKLTGYHTQSVMVVPMENDRGEIIGVLQLINATNSTGDVCPFGMEDELTVTSIASQAAIALTNMNYSKQITELLYSFVRVMSTGIDARTPYNANHTRNMVKYGGYFFDYESETGGPYRVDDDRRQEILMSVWLHDIGKLITPLEIMDKSTRLSAGLDRVENRFGRIDLLIRLAGARGEYTPDETQRRLEETADDLEFIRGVNAAGFLPDEKLERIEQIGRKTYTEIDGTETPYLTADELTQLSVRKGTLTQAERKIMESHVSMTKKMLSELDFPKDFEHVPLWAGTHHEYLNGRGYPDHLTADDLTWEARLITILDIFEALTAKDRPYKPPMPAEKALSILDSMVSDGQLDRDLFEEFRRSNAWERG